MDPEYSVALIFDRKMKMKEIRKLFPMYEFTRDKDYETYYNEVFDTRNESLYIDILELEVDKTIIVMPSLQVLRPDFIRWHKDVEPAYFAFLYEDIHAGLDAYSVGFGFGEKCIFKYGYTFNRYENQFSEKGDYLGKLYGREQAHEAQDHICKKILGFGLLFVDEYTPCKHYDLELKA